MLSGGQAEGRVIEVQNGSGVTYTVPPAHPAQPGGQELRAVLPGEPHLRRLGDSGHQRRPDHCPLQAGAPGPGEMENITLPKVLLDKAGDTLTVSIREVD